MSFWTRYVLLKEQDGVDRLVLLVLIEQKKGLPTRQLVEQELAQLEV